MRRDYFQTLIRDKSIPAANFRLAHLLLGERDRKPLASLVITTNFDDFLTRALQLFGKEHVVCDSPSTTQRLVLSNADRLQVVHVHGTYYFYEIKNLSGEVEEAAAASEETTATMGSLLEAVLRDQSPIVVGYGGWDGDVFMKSLQKRLKGGTLPQPLYWCCYRRNEWQTLPKWLRTHSSVRFVEPEESRSVGTSVAPKTQTPGYGAIVSAAADLLGQNPEPETFLDAQSVFDGLIQALDLKPPALTQNPIKFFADYLNRCLPQDGATQGTDLYKIKATIEELQAAANWILEYRRQRTATQKQLEAVRERLRGAKYVDAMPLVLGIDVKELSEQETNDLWEMAWEIVKSSEFGERPSDETLAMLDRFEQIAALLPIREDTSRRVTEGLIRRVIHLLSLNQFDEAGKSLFDLVERSQTSDDSAIRVLVADRLFEFGRSCLESDPTLSLQLSALLLKILGESPDERLWAVLDRALFMKGAAAFLTGSAREEAVDAWAKLQSRVSAGTSTLTPEFIAQVSVLQPNEGADQFSRLMRLSGMQSESMRLLIEADRLKQLGDPAIAQPAYDRLIESLKLQLAETKSLNADFPAATLIDLVAVVNPLVDALLIQADLQEAQGRRDESRRLREEAAAITQEHLNEEGSAERQRQLAGSFLTQGRFHEGLIALAAARDLFVKQKESVSAAETGADLANYFEWLGDDERALEETGRAEQLIATKLAGGTPSTSDVWASLGSAINLSGQASEADAFSEGLRQALEKAKLQKISIEIDQIRARIGRRAGRYDEAEQLFDRVAPHIPTYARPAIRWQIAMMRIRQERFEDALAILEEISADFETGVLRQKLPVFLRTKSEALLGLNRAEDALREIDGALEAIEKCYDPDALWTLHWIRARILERLGHRGKALEAILASTAIVDELRRAPLGWRLDSTFLRDKLPMFRRGIRLAVEVGDAATCCQLIEKVKARALAAALHAPAQSGGAVADSGDKRRVDQLSVELDALDYGAYMEGWTDDRQKQRRALLDERTALLERLRIADPRWRALTAPVPLNLAEVQAKLASRGQAVLDLFYEPERISVVLVTGDSLRVESRELAVETRKDIGQYLANLATPHPEARFFDPNVLPALDLESLLPASLVESALDARSLIVIPHGSLHLLLWAALPWRGQRLFERLPVSVLPNLACLTALQGGFTNPPHAAILGAPDYAPAGLTSLDGAREELRTVAEIYMDSAGLIGKPLTGANATESGFWELARAPQPKGAILHLACHARFENEEPQHSALQLADGQVDVAEISAARVNFEEVILSACNTGQRALKVQNVELTGDDILGLPGAFLEAGVRSVLVSIPPASDSAAIRFMALYHEERSAGTTPLCALQKAQVMMLAEGLHPIDTWIGFTLYGAQ
jgi:CHAT domain-containing protein